MWHWLGHSRPEMSTPHAASTRSSPTHPPQDQPHTPSVPALSTLQALLLTEHLLRNSSQHVVQVILEAAQGGVLEGLKQFKYLDEKNKDQGINVGGRGGAARPGNTPADAALPWRGRMLWWSLPLPGANVPALSPASQHANASVHLHLLKSWGANCACHACCRCPTAPRSLACCWTTQTASGGRVIGWAWAGENTGGGCSH